MRIKSPSISLLRSAQKSMRNRKSNLPVTSLTSYLIARSSRNIRPPRKELNRIRALFNRTATEGSKQSFIDATTSLRSTRFRTKLLTSQSSGFNPMMI